MDQLKPLIDQLTEIIKGTKDFTISQAPDFVRQFIIMSYLGALGWLVFCAIILAFSIKWERWLKQNWEDIHEEKAFFSTLLVLLGLIGGTFGVIGNLQDILVIRFAPKVYVVQHLLDLGKSK